MNNTSSSSSQKVIVVTGASGHLGKVVVEKFVREGHRVIAVVSPNRSPDFSVVGSLEIKEAVLTDEVSVGALVKEVMVRYGQIDAALLLAGSYAAGHLQDTDTAVLEKMYTANFVTAYNVARAVFQPMATTVGGRIVLIGSRPALEAAEGKKAVAYGLSKSLLFTLADYLNAESTPYNIVTHVVTLSMIDTPTNRTALPNAHHEEWVTPEAIAEMLLFLTDGRGNDLSGTVLKVYGNNAK